MREFQGTHLWSISHQFQDVRTAGTQSMQRARPAAKRSRREGGGSAPGALLLMGPSPWWRRLSPTGQQTPALGIGVPHCAIQTFLLRESKHPSGPLHSWDGECYFKDTHDLTGAPQR